MADIAQKKAPPPLHGVPLALLTLAVAFAILNAMWLEVDEKPPEQAPRDDKVRGDVAPKY